MPVCTPSPPADQQLSDNAGRAVLLKGGLRVRVKVSPPCAHGLVQFIFSPNGGDAVCHGLLGVNFNDGIAGIMGRDAQTAVDDILVAHVLRI